MIKMLSAIFVSIMLISISCGGGGGDSGGDSDDPVIMPTGQVSIYNQIPTFRNAFTTTETPVTISGMGSGPIETVTWENLTTGESGNGSWTNAWSVKVPLQADDNEIAITATPLMASSVVAENSVTLTLTVTYNTSVNFTSLVELTPNTGLVGETYDDVYVRVGIDPSDLDADSVKLYHVDASGEKKGDALASLTDDGNLDNGDEIQGDGIYSAKISLAPVEAEPINMRIFAENIYGAESKTSLFIFKVFAKPTDEQLQQQAEINEDAFLEFEELISSKMGTLGLTKSEAVVASLDEMVTFLKTLDGVIEAGTGAYGVWWFNDAGMFFVLSATPLAGEEEESYAEGWDRPDHEDFDPTSVQPDSAGYDVKSTGIEYLRTNAPILDRAVADTDDEKYNIGNLAAIHIMPFKHTISWYKTKHPGGWYSIVEASECPAFTTTVTINELHDPMTSEATEPVPLSTWKSLSNYGLIVSATHGDSMDVPKKKLEEKYPEMKQIDWLFPWHNERPVLHINIAIDWTADALAPYLADILAGRIMLWPNSGNKVGLIITPEFISHYNGTFPNTIWINISCRGARTDALGAAFIAKGGGAWYGYSDYVKSSYAQYTEKEILKQLIENGKNVKESFDAAVAAQGANDGDSHPAALKLLGEHKTKVGQCALAYARANLDLRLKTEYTVVEPSGTTTESQDEDRWLYDIPRGGLAADNLSWDGGWDNSVDTDYYYPGTYTGSFNINFSGTDLTTINDFELNASWTTTSSLHDVTETSTVTIEGTNLQRTGESSYTLIGEEVCDHITGLTDVYERRGSANGINLDRTRTLTFPPTCDANSRLIIWLEK